MDKKDSNDPSQVEQPQAKKTWIKPEINKHQCKKTAGGTNAQGSQDTGYYKPS